MIFLTLIAQSIYKLNSYFNYLFDFIEVYLEQIKKQARNQIIKTKLQKARFFRIQQFMKKKQNKKSKNLSLLSNIKTNYCCSGTIENLKGFKVFYQNSDFCRVIKFPNPDQTQIINVIKSAKISGFGKHHQNVVDQEYRKAYEILPQNLGITSEFSSIIADNVSTSIKNLLNMAAVKIQPQLLKLNIYEKGCFFKNHVDSPKPNSFGSLVVFLPCYFEGGELIVSQGNETIKYDFGTKQKSKKINWVAFFNDCVHNIEEVKAGYRLTLSYNLCYEPLGLVKITPNKQMYEIISNLEMAKTYSYYCEHYYGNHTLNTIAGNELSILKGKDALLWNCCMELKLKIQLNVLIQDKICNSQGEEQQIRFLSKPKNFAKVEAGIVVDDEYRSEANQYMISRFESTYKAKQVKNFQEIVWLNTLTDEAKYVYAIDGYHGNDFSLYEQYCQLVMLIQT